MGTESVFWMRGGRGGGKGDWRMVGFVREKRAIDLSVVCLQNYCRFSVYWCVRACDCLFLV